MELAGFLRSIGLDFVPIRTNVMASIGPMATRAWSRAQHGAIYASAGHALGARVDRVFIASTHQVGHLQPWGSHPLIDPYLSSGYVRIIHDNFRLDRSQMTVLVGDWPEAMDVLNVCVGASDERRDKGCGECEKCVRTAATLVAAGRAEVAEKWRGSPLTVDTILSVRVIRPGTAQFWSRIAGEFQTRGFTKLAEAAKSVVNRYRRRALVSRAAGFFRRSVG